MKTRINLTIDKEIVPLAKRYARKMGKSVSELVELLLREHIQMEEPTFSQKWLGKFTVEVKNERRFEKLSQRYQL
ncbi:MAG: hypothetical protein D6748_04590 [Calditrichaeota bacterium]|nr:MAG: hypothetical protein D6748_04590 [Calditrichota bacterium]